MEKICRAIKEDLQLFYDIPFDVKLKMEYQDPVFTISPYNELEELFEVKIYLRQRIRLIVEIEPQKYSASMMESINKADVGKRAVFLQYVELIRRKGAKIEFYINKQPRNVLDEQTWNEAWNSFRIRATQIIDEMTIDNLELELMIDWSRLAVGLLLSLLEIENKEEKQYFEGRVYQVTQNRYERNPVNRELCLSANGYSCKICGFNFEETYGEIGHEFIHVHHIEMVSSFGGEYCLDPVNDMIPVCPNCHAMLHRKTPPYMPEEIREIIKNMKMLGEES
ncbi:MAG: HNH endonuclease [Lachnospiraceae bacterium]|nr:HNH endonuclease [Lachnospiraceae bacterium]